MLPSQRGANLHLRELRSPGGPSGNERGAAAADEKPRRSYHQYSTHAAARCALDRAYWLLNPFIDIKCELFKLNQRDQEATWYDRRDWGWP